MLHGREDRVIPLANSLTLADWIPNSQLHVFGHCGHWTQIGHAARFNRLVSDFFAEADAAPADAGKPTPIDGAPHDRRRRAGASTGVGGPFASERVSA